MESKIKDLIRPLYYIALMPKTKAQCRSTRRELSSYKNKYSGKRCFIVGNGPSLTCDDLDKISSYGDFSFGCNRIYILFDKTKWRPSFYVNQDPKVIRGCIEEINALDSNQVKFIKALGKTEYEVPGAIYYDFHLTYRFNKKIPKFSDDAVGGLYNGYTVTYTALQLAVYMGFKEIYLLGCDCNYSVDNKSIDINSYPDYRMYDPKKVGRPPDIEQMFISYKVVKNECENRGIVIKNATRGGMLEVFDRVQFEELFKNN